MVYDIKEISQRFHVSEEDIYKIIKLKIFSEMRISQCGRYYLDEFWVDHLKKCLCFRKSHTKIMMFNKKKKRKFKVDLTEDEMERLEKFLAIDIDKEELEEHCINLDKKLLNLRGELEERKRFSRMNILSRLVRSF